ncbi:poly [ADP-ribose] polymerase 2 isoform X2 [Denticeps clupeoides]|uniref:poly [ADP-ribose] polymerase 2 isoform X2 n=1 Tax=Denticeps clupeoides TaxID=299321 RepID=UPI0010A57F96|nr:poly [ADP-ribose] polymerase 2 isoform X2 [Denticeps clupeoides]
MRRTRSSRNKTPDNSGASPGVWQWEGDEGRWEPYCPADSARLDAAVTAGRKSATLSASAGSVYRVDLVKMVQTNTVTGYKRKVRLHTFKPESTDEGDPVIQSSQHTGLSQIKAEEEEEDMKPLSKKRRCATKNVECGSAEENKEVVKSVVMKGKAPVDPECKAKVGKAHVYCEGADIYDVMLNQTNLQFNNNKYYLIQLLQDDAAKVFSVWMRWGRVGKVGQNSLMSYGSDLLKAKDVFKKKFFDKTKNEWEGRATFEKVPGKYDMVYMDYSTNDKEEEAEKSGDKASDPAQQKICKLNPKVKSLLELICDMKAMEECVLEMKFNIKKAPLGKLTAEQIRAGYESLKRIEDCIKRNGKSKELLDACNQFYTRIPHDFGLRSPPVIRTEEELKEKIALLETLSDIQIAVKMAESSSDSKEHPLDKQYHSLHCQLTPVPSDCNEYQVIEKYLQSTHAPTHSDYTMTILDIFAVDRDKEKDNFLSQMHNRTLLWHGSRLTNWVGILSQGLRVAPPEAPVTGYMFGKGIYFADMSSKSANYCFANQNNKLPPGKHSTKGLGQTSPDPNNFVTLDDGVKVPMGPGVNTGVGQNGGYNLLYNEFIVYNPAQTRMRYLLRVRFNFSSLW